MITEAAYDGVQDKNRLGGYLPSECTTPIACTNAIVPAPDSRVLLLSSIPESTYINANYIKVWNVDLRPVHICYATVLGL